ncbi:hypothetical protein ACFC58_10240 [Kitasatospora purpeofusca]|uniref:hypothetical protein n=1 Tax=Kitasatospora purpeofusca TaxID=67352 RepID=UPI0035D78998
MVDSGLARRRLAGVLREQYRAWPVLADRLHPVLELFGTIDRTAEITEASTRLLLDLLGWPGRGALSGW